MVAKKTARHESDELFLGHGNTVSAPPNTVFSMQIYGKKTRKSTNPEEKDAQVLGKGKNGKRSRNVGQKNNTL